LKLIKISIHKTKAIVYQQK